MTPTEFCAALQHVAPHERDAWLDAFLGIDEVIDDGLDLPRGGVPYMPCSVEAILRAIEYARVQPTDVVVDVGAGIGRAAALLHLATGATTIGLEIQPALVAAFRELTTRRALSRVTVVEGDAAITITTPALAEATVFFLYCPFSDERLTTLLAALRVITRTRTIRICCVDLPIAPRAWLTRVSPASADLDVYVSCSESTSA